MKSECGFHEVLHENLIGMVYFWIMVNLREQVSMHPKWSAFFIFAGVVAIISMFASLLSFVGDTGNSLRVDKSLPPASSEEFFQTVAGVTHSAQVSGGTVTILNNGDEFFPAFYDAIKQAQKTINITWYVWVEGEASRQTHDVLKEALARGVQVRILLDGLDGDMPEEERESLVEAGAIIEDFRDPEIGKLTRVHRRNHRRSVVVDGKVGFTGGMAISDYWLGNADSPEHWRDFMIKVTGPLARSVQSAFADLWAGAHGEILAGDDFFPAHPADANTGLRSIHVVSSPFEDTQMLPNFFWLSINSAQKTLYVASPYFVPSPAITDALKERAAAGVDVKVLLPSNHNDERMAFYAARSHYEELIRAGVKVYEYQPTMIHSKVIITDGIWSAVGSPNLDYHSMEFNEENILGFQDAKIAAELSADFQEDLSRAVEIKLEEWQKRSLREKIFEFLAMRVSKQL